MQTSRWYKMHGVSAVIVEKNCGYKNGQTFEKMGLRTCQLGEIILENCKILWQYTWAGKNGNACI